jgi:hypothetical protein
LVRFSRIPIFDVRIFDIRIFDRIDFIVIVETKIEQAYNVAKTERLAEIWDEANDAVFNYINNKYKIKLPIAFLHETKRRNDDDDANMVDDDDSNDNNDNNDDNAKMVDDDDDNAVDDGRIESVLKKLNLSNAEGINLFIDTANKAMLLEFHNLKGKLVKLDSTVAVIDGAKQPTLKKKNAQNVYANLPGLEKKPVCIGDICFYLREHVEPLKYSKEFPLSEYPLSEYPIVIFKDDKPIMGITTTKNFVTANAVEAILQGIMIEYPLLSICFNNESISYIRFIST